MKQIEITVEVKESLKSARKKLENLGFKIIRESDIEDIYMTSNMKDLNMDNIQYV